MNILDYLEYYNYVGDDDDSITEFENVIIDLDLCDQEIKCFESGGLSELTVSKLLSEVDDEEKIKLYRSLSKNVKESRYGSYYHKLFFTMTKFLNEHHESVDTQRILFELRLEGVDLEFLNMSEYVDLY